VLTCIIFSTNYSVIKRCQSLGFQGLDPSFYAAIRFSLAGLILLPRALGSFRNTYALKASALVGLTKFVGYFGQSLGLVTSTANKSSFICSLKVVFIAVVQGIIHRNFNLQTWCAIALAIGGICFVELEGSAVMNKGDAWLLLQPLGFGTSDLLLSYFLTATDNNMHSDVKAGCKVEPAAIASLSMLALAFASIAWTVAVGGHRKQDLVPILGSTEAMAGLVYAGAVGTAGGVLLQSIAFKRVPVMDASIILTCEPLFASCFAAGKEKRPGVRAFSGS
jgi:drug/metabolite transporter (DMT)-like permease